MKGYRRCRAVGSVGSVGGRHGLYPSFGVGLVGAACSDGRLDLPASTTDDDESAGMFPPVPAVSFSFNTKDTAGTFPPYLYSASRKERYGANIPAYPKPNACSSSYNT